MTWISHGREEILVANIGGEYRAMDNVCAHSGGALADGYLDGNIVMCPLHGWEYDVTNGINTFDTDLKQEQFQVKVDGNDILVAL